MARFAKSVNPSFNACVLNDITDGVTEIRIGWSVGRKSLVILSSPEQERKFPPRFTPFIPHLLLRGVDVVCGLLWRRLLKGAILSLDHLRFVHFPSSSSTCQDYCTEIGCGSSIFRDVRLRQIGDFPNASNCDSVVWKFRSFNLLPPPPLAHTHTLSALCTPPPHTHSHTLLTVPLRPS